MNKRSLILLLIGVNLFLLGVLALSVYTPPSALAQTVGARPGSYLLFAGRADVTNDAMYLLDAGTKKLHVFRSAYPRSPVNGMTAVAYASTRDLKTEDRKSTRLNSSHRCISYAVFCLK